MKTRKNKRIVLHVTLLTLLTLSFQNCSFPGDKPDSSSQNKTLQYSGGGTGFDGKGSYVNRILDGVCELGGDVRNRIEINEGQAVQTKADCRDIPPQPIKLADLQLMPHNLENLVSSERVFDREKNDATPSGVLCRGFEPGTGGNTTWQVADVTVNHDFPGGPTAPARFGGTLKLGWYDSASGKLRASASSNELRLTRSTDATTGWVIYEGVAVITHLGETHEHQIKLELKRPNDRTTGHVTIRFSPTFGLNGFRLFDDKRSERRSGFYSIANCYTP